MEKLFPQLKSSERRQLSQTRETMVGIPAGPREMGCVVVPVHHLESETLERTLRIYSEHEEILSHTFSIMLYVNGTNPNVAFSPAANVIDSIQTSIPEMPLIVAFAQYQHIKMGTLRRDASILAIERANEAGLELNHYLLINHDADLKGLPKRYFSSGYEEFSSNPQLSIVSGLAYYDENDYKSYETLLWLQRFGDVLNIYRRRKNGFIRGEENNLWIRAQNYLNAGGHNRARISESANLIKKITGSDMSKILGTTRKSLRATYDPRRHFSVVRSGQLFSDQYEYFGTDSDHIHGNPQTELQSRDYSGINKEVLSVELSEIFLHQLLGICFRKIHSNPLSNRSAEQVFDLCYCDYREDTIELISKFSRCSQFLGISICFEKNIIRID